MMVQFSALPVEILSEIWRHIPEPEDVKSYARASRRIHDTGEPFLKQHRQLQSKHHKLEVINRFETMGLSLSQILQDVLLNLRVALYVEILCIDSWTHE